MTESSRMICPICDSKISREKDECPVCGVSLIPFKEDYEGEIDEEAIEKVIDVISEEDEELINDLEIEDDLDLEMDEYTEGDILEEEEKELLDDPEDFGLSEDETSTEGEQEQKQGEVITFECPICKSEVSEDATECPDCGVVFEEDSGDRKVEKNSEDDSDIEEDLEEGKDEGVTSLEKGEETFEDLEGSEDEEFSADLQNRIDSFSEDIEELKRSDVEVKEIEDHLRELEEAYERGDKEKGGELVEEIKDKIDHAQEIAERKKRCEHYLDWLSGRTDIYKLEGWIDDIHKGCKIGEYRLARKKAKETEEDIKEIAETFELEEGGRLEEEIKEGKEKVKDDISQIEALDLDLDTQTIEEKLEDASVEKDEGDLEEAFHRVMEAKKAAEELSRFGAMAAEGKSKVESLKQQGDDHNHQKFFEKIEQGKDEARKGNITKAKEMVEECIDKIEKKEKNLEEKKETEEEEREITGKEKKKNHFKNIQEKIPEMKGLLRTAKDFDVEIEEGKEWINEAVEHTKQQEYDKAVELLDDCRDLFQEKLDEKIDLEVKEIEKNGSGEIRSTIEDIKEYKQRGAYEKALNLIKREKEKTSSEKDLEVPIEQKISELKNIINKGEEIGVNFPQVLHLLEVGKRRSEEDSARSQEMIEKAQNKTFQRLENFLEKEIRESRNELKQAKAQGVDISKAVELLKNTDRTQKEGDLKESLDNFKKFKDKMEKIRKKL